MKLITVNNVGQPQITELNDDDTVMVSVDCASAVLAGSAVIPPLITYQTIAACRWVDSSNFCIQLPLPALKVLEVYADGGTITIFPVNASGGASTFLDGSSSVSTSTGVQFRAVSASGNLKWAKLN